MDPAAAAVEDLLQAPVLYISGSRRRTCCRTPRNCAITSTAADSSSPKPAAATPQRFDEGFRQLMAAVFPEPEYQLQRITPGHPIWRMQDMVRPDSPYAGRLWGVEYGCRTCVVYSRAGSVVLLGAGAARPMAAPSRSRVDEHIADALAIGVNVLTYATNREPKGKEQSFVTPLGGR